MLDSRKAVKFKNQNPARGRKLWDSLRVSYIEVKNLRTRTPQGDGNIARAAWLIIGFMIFKNQNPARGRKLISVVTDDGRRR